MGSRMVSSTSPRSAYLDPKNGLFERLVALSTSPWKALRAPANSLMDSDRSMGSSLEAQVARHRVGGHGDFLRQWGTLLEGLEDPGRVQLIGDLHEVWGMT